MSVRAKICGINSRAALDAAIAGGASHVGFNFYPPSPRALSDATGRELASIVPPGVVKVGLLVDEPDDVIARILGAVPLDLLQLHGSESPARVRDVKTRFDRPVMKAIKVAEPGDIAIAERYVETADWLLFDAKAPADMKGALPGGNALSFDWQLLAGRHWPLSWMLSGGLNIDNVAAAAHISGASFVDVSSGVEDRPGVKNPVKIAAFLQQVRKL
ncbi:MAG: phosphoribosylanthranilate isomerase [Dongiaceae bacterium]